MAIAKAKQACESCKFLDVPLRDTGRPHFKRGCAYRCTFVVPKMALPDSITRYIGYNDSFSPNSRSHMQRTDGTTCPTWTLREVAGDA